MYDLLMKRKLSVETVVISLSRTSGYVARIMNSNYPKKDKIQTIQSVVRVLEHYAHKAESLDDSAKIREHSSMWYHSLEDLSLNLERSNWPHTTTKRPSKKVYF